jgi:hypothetical protein
MISFKNWLLKEDIFGFDKLFKIDAPKAVQDDIPITPLNIEVTIETLLKMPLKEQAPFSRFVNEIQWGNYNGAIRMVISPLGSFKSIIRTMQTNLEGNQTWICKKIIPYKDLMHANIENHEDLAHKLFGKIEEINQFESAIGNYNNFESLVVKLVHECQRPNIMPELFIFRGVKEIKHNENYIIYFECRGQGVETPGSGRLEIFSIDMSYNPKTGLIRSYGHDIQSRTKGHSWTPQPSEWDEYLALTFLFSTRPFL